MVLLRVGGLFSRSSASISTTAFSRTTTTKKLFSPPPPLLVRSSIAPCAQQGWVQPTASPLGIWLSSAQSYSTNAANKVDDNVTLKAKRARRKKESASAHQSVSPQDVMRSVVKLHVAGASPDFSLPWQRGEPFESSGSGCIIEGPSGRLRILTAAHVVENHTFVRVQRQDIARYFPAKVVSQSPDCDCALLEVQDAKFYEGLQPLQFADTPSLQSTVTAIGYPQGGESLCATRGVVSRLELHQYKLSHSFMDEGLKLLTLQIDAAINPGNSGGPVLDQHHKIVGVVFQKMGGHVESVGYVIPAEIIQHFLTDVDAGRSPQFCHYGFDYQKADNDSLRRWAKLSKAQTGILVTRVDELSSANGVIHSGDILTSCEGISIGNDGTVPFKGMEHLRVSFEYLVARKYVGDPITFGLIRNGEQLTVKVNGQPRQYLIPPYSEQLNERTSPSYFIHAGLVFASLDEGFIDHSDDHLSPITAKYYYQNTKRHKDEQVVALIKILQDEVNAGFHHYHANQLVSFNGERINNLKQLIERVENCKEPFLDFKLDSCERIILETYKAKKATERILKRYGIRNSKSEDLVKQDKNTTEEQEEEEIVVDKKKKKAKKEC